MPEAIADATPLIYLSAIDRFGLLNAFFDRILVPEAVWEEVVVQGRGKPGRNEVLEAGQDGWIQRWQAPERGGAFGLATRLEPGEVQAIATALQRSEAILLLDERAARSVADSFNLTFTGTVGLLLRAKKEKRISELRPSLERLRQDAGFWLGDGIFEEILQAAGEA